MSEEHFITHRHRDYSVPKVHTQLRKQARLGKHPLTIREKHQKNHSTKRPVEPIQENAKSNNDVNNGWEDAEQNELQQQHQYQVGRSPFFGDVLTSKMRLMAAPRSRMRRTSPVFLRIWKAKDKFKRWSKANCDMPEDVVQIRYRIADILPVRQILAGIAIRHTRVEDSRD